MKTDLKCPFTFIQRLRLPGLCSAKRAAVGPLLALATLVVLRILQGPQVDLIDPAPLLLLNIVLAVLISGVASGLVTTFILCLYFASLFSIPGHPFHYTSENLRRILTLAVLMPFVAVTVNLVRRKTEESLYRELEAHEAVERKLYQNAEALEGRVLERTRALEAANAALTAEIQERRRAETSLRESEERLRFALAAANVVAWEWDLETGLSARSTNAGEVLGVTSGPLQDFYEMVHVEDRARVSLAVDRALAGEAPYDEEFRIVLPSGEIRWVADMGDSRFGSCGRARHFAGVCVDITERKAVEQAMKHAMQTAEEANRAKSRFLANMSHEIRTPLGALLGFTELLREPTLSRSERRTYMDVVRRNGKELSRLIDDILDLSKVEAGRLDVETVETSLPTLLTEVTALLNIEAQNKNVRLLVDSHSPIPPVVETDPTRLRQILINIIGNAIKFTNAGDVTVTVRSQRAKDNSAQIAFVVKDTGPGIPYESRERLFQAFMQADSSTTRRFGGTGLGLALSRRLARALGGDVVLFESTPGKGSTFVVTIAAGAVAAAPPPDVTPATTESPTGLAGPFEVHSLPGSEKRDRDRTTLQARIKQRNTAERLKGVRVLVVDDAPDNQFLIERILSLTGAEVALADNGEKGAALALEGNFDVVIMDIQMPVLDGYDAARLLRARGFTRPLIAVTAHAMKEERERCLMVGFTDYLTKPISPMGLVATVARYSRHGRTKKGQLQSMPS